MSSIPVKQTMETSGGDGNHPEQPHIVETLRPGRRFEWLRNSVRKIPTFLVIVVLGGIGIYGHHSGWKMPKFTALVGGDSDRQDDWCEEHGVPESQCVECHPDLMPHGKDFGWCKEHGVSNCPLCHPEAVQLKQTPEAVASDRDRAARTLASAPRKENNAICKNYRRRIQFASDEAVKKAGVDVTLVDRQRIVEAISANGQITYDQAHYASLSSRLPGTARHLEKNVGDRVRAGEVLALIDAAEVGRAKTELIQALAHENFQQNSLKRLEAVKDIVSGGKILESHTEDIQARARLLSAQQTLSNLGLPVEIERLRALSDEELVKHLRFLGLPENLAQQLEAEETTANLLPLMAPLDGTIVSRQVVAGEVVDASRILFQLADTSRMWLTLSVPLEDAGKLALGQPVRFRPDGSPEEVSGTLVWISTTADPQTRMVAVRAELPNPAGKLRNETFGSGRILLREEQEAIVVPNDAVHWEGCCHVVFVRDKGYFDGKESSKVFHVRTVRLGAKNEKYTEIVAGVLPGEVVATKGSDVLRAELLKNSLGEGCCAGK